jgi:SulP family sulfate permease
VLAGVVVGIMLSLGWLIWVATTPPMPLLGREPGTQVYRDLDENPGDETFPGVVVLRLDSGLFFATSQALEDRVRALAQDASRPVRVVVLDLEGISFIDSQDAAQLAAILELLENDRVTLRLARGQAGRTRRAARGRLRRPPRRGSDPRQRPSRRRGATAR